MCGRRSKRKSLPQCIACGRRRGKLCLHVFFDPVGCRVDIGRDGDGEINVVGNAKGIAPAEERLSVCRIFVADNFVQAVDKNVGDIKVAGVQPSDKALQNVKAVNLVVARFDQANAIVNAKHQLVAFFNADRAAGLVFDGGVD